MTGQQLKNSILQLAIQGKLVPQDPNDEPASELLKRIRKEKEQLVKDGKLKKKDLEVTPITEDEKPFDLPDGWEWCRLGYISTYASTKKKINAANAESTLWGLDLEDIQRGGTLLCKKSVGERQAVGDKTFFYTGDILYSKLRPYLLKILLAPEGGICTPEIVPFRCYDNISHRYIVELLKSPYVDEYINSTTFGVKMPRVGTETMVSLLVPLPPLTEQERIVAKIEELLPLVEEYGKAQEELNKLNATLPDKLRQSILQEAIMGKLVPQDPNDEPACKLLERIQEEKKRLVKEGKLKKKDLEVTPISDEEKPFDLPNGWEWCRWGTLATSIQYGFNAPAETTGEIRMVRISDIQNGSIIWETVPYCNIPEKEIDNYLLEKNDILFARTGGTVGKSYIVKETPLKAVYAGYLIRTRYSKNLEPMFLKYFMESSLYWSQLMIGTKGAAQPNCNGKTLSQMIIPLPPLAEQKRIVAKLEELLPMIDGLKVK